MITDQQHQQHFALHARAERLLKDIQKAADKLGGVNYDPAEAAKVEAFKSAVKAASNCRFALIETYDITNTLTKSYRPRR